LYAIRRWPPANTSLPPPAHQIWLQCLILSRERGYAATRFHESNCRFSGRVAACGAGTAHRPDADDRHATWPPPARPRSDRPRQGIQLGMRDLGWIEGRNVQIDYRFAGTSVESINKNVTELVQLTPDVIVANGSAIMAALRPATSTIPIVFAVVSDPECARVAGLNRWGQVSLHFGTDTRWFACGAHRRRRRRTYPRRLRCAQLWRKEKGGWCWLAAGSKRAADLTPSVTAKTNLRCLSASARGPTYAQ